MILSSIKIACLVVGAIVGAGFATGAEVTLYFNNTGIITPILACIFIGILSFVFGCFGNVAKKSKVCEWIYKTMIFLSSLITFIAMIVGAEELMYACFNIKYIGLISGIVISITCYFSMKFVKNFNFIIIPIIIVLMISIMLKSKWINYNFPNSFWRGLNYASMNLLLSSYLISKECENLSKKQIFLISLIITVLILLLLLMMYNIALQAPKEDMPMFVMASSLGLQVGGGLIIYFSIVSTLIGAGKVCCDMVADFSKSKIIGVFFLLCIAVMGYNAKFNYMVNIFYPIIGYMGIVASIYALATILYNQFNAQHALKLSFQTLAPKNTFRRQARKE